MYNSVICEYSTIGEVVVNRIRVGKIEYIQHTITGLVNKI